MIPKTHGYGTLDPLLPTRPIFGPLRGRRTRRTR
jgi:hypothetical protein